MALLRLHYSIGKLHKAEVVAELAQRLDVLGLIPAS